MDRARRRCLRQTLRRDRLCSRPWAGSDKGRAVQVVTGWLRGGYEVVTGWLRGGYEVVQVVTRCVDQRQVAYRAHGRAAATGDVPMRYTCYIRYTPQPTGDVPKPRVAQHMRATTGHHDRSIATQLAPARSIR